MRAFGVCLVTAGPGALAVGASKVWVTDQIDNQLWYLVPAALNVPQPPVAVGNQPVGVAFGEGFVWVTNYGDGTVYKIDKTRHETILYNFTLGKDGGLPESGLILDSAGNLYGTTMLGGDLACNGGSGCGTIFKLDANGHETILHNFENMPGEFPRATLVMDASGTLFGTTAGNDLANYGSVFKLMP
jgi:uncharacterized repeat protein (TIGR03803 family)